MSRPTVRDIARRLDISPSTVYRVLNGSQLVKDETRRRIEAVAAELGYEKRQIRRHGPRTILTIALFLPRSRDVYHRLFYDPADLLAGIGDGFGDVKTHVSVSVNIPNPDLFKFKKSGNIDGCIFGFTVPSPTVRALLKKRNIPTVLLNRESRSCSYVSADHLAGMRALLARASAHRASLRPCYISFIPAQPVAEMRESAFLEACRREELPFGERDIIRIKSVEEIDGNLLADIAARYNAAFCFNDFVAVYFYQMALLAGVAVPEDLGIAGYDDSAVRQLTPQKIDSVSLSPYRFGFEAGKWLQGAIIDHDTTTLRLRIPGTLIPGETL